MDKVAYLLKTAWKSNKKLFLIVVLHNVFEAIISMINILGIGVVVDALINGKSRKSVITVIAVYIGINLCVALARELFMLCKDIEQRKATNALQYQYAWQALIVDFKSIQTKEFLNLKRNSMRVMPAFYVGNFGRFISYIAKFAGIISIFAVINPVLIMTIILLSVPSVIMSFRWKKAKYEYKKDITPFENKSDYLYRTMTEYNYAKDIRVYGGKELICNKYIKNSEEQLKRQSKLGLRNMNRQNMAYLFSAIQLFVMLVYFSYLVYGKEISIAQYTVLLSSTTLFASILGDFFNNIAEIKAMCGYVSIIKEYDLFIESNSKVYTNKIIEKSNLNSISIEFKNVCFKYPNTEKTVLDNVSFRIGAGEKVSFVGGNGAGKTTIIKLLLRLYMPDSGTIKINGIDIHNIDSKEYYERIGIVLQDFFIFAYSVAENLCFDTEIEMSRIESAIEQADMKEIIAKLPKGIYTSMYKSLDKDGVELSGGEGQKLAMARALYKNTGLLIFDEPTSSLDPLAEYEMFSKMRQISENNTTIMVSHRLSSTKYSDRILVFDGGKLVQDGSHAALMNEAGIYKELFMTQAKYYTGESELYA